MRDADTLQFLAEQCEQTPADDALALEELFGEDGQGMPEEEWSDEQCRDLAERLNATFAAWAKEHGHDKAYMLDLSAGEIVTIGDAA